MRNYDFNYPVGIRTIRRIWSSTKIFVEKYLVLQFHYTMVSLAKK